MVGGDLVVAVSGDDSVVSWGNTFGHYSGFGEADQSQFDHTQDLGPQYAAAIWMNKLGAPGWFVDMVRECCTGRYSVDFRRLRIKGEAGCQMPTGITMTTVLNSMSTIFMYVNLFRNKHLDVPSAGRELGFKVKYFPARDVGDVTFLKGWWRWSGESLVWLPLPSAIVKLGKLLRAPWEIIGMSKAERNSPLGREVSYGIAANALSMSYGNVPFDYPILGPFLKVLRKFHPGRDGVASKISLESWKPVVVGMITLSDDTTDAVCRRYNITTDDIDRVTALIEGVSRLPAYIEDPVFDALVVTDY